MKTSLRFLTVSCIFLVTLTSCGRPDHVGSPIAGDLPVLTVTQAIEPSRMGKRVLVRGEVNEVCQDEGCWLTIVDNNSGIRISPAGSGFVVPMDLQGTVLVEGYVRDEVFSEADAKLIAETMGWDSKEIESIHSDTRLPVLTATGVQFEDN